MTFDDYQEQAVTTDVWGGKQVPVMHPAFMDKVLGLMGESGEVSDKFKKILRDKQGELTEDDRQELKKELGDIQWYIALVGHYLGLSLDDIAMSNIDKLKSRQQRGQLRGSGDNR